MAINDDIDLLLQIKTVTEIEVFRNTASEGHVYKVTTRDGVAWIYRNLPSYDFMLWSVIQWKPCAFFGLRDLCNQHDLSLGFCAQYLNLNASTLLRFWHTTGTIVKQKMMGGIETDLMSEEAFKQFIDSL